MLCAKLCLSMLVCLAACEGQIRNAGDWMGGTLAQEFMEAGVKKLPGPTLQHLMDRKWFRWVSRRAR